MSLLKAIKTGAAPAPIRLLVYGTPGIGKTTFAAQIPGALFLTCEEGGGDMDYARIEVVSWRALMDTLGEIERDGMPEGYRVLVLDTINGFSERCADFICERARCDSLEEVGGGFGKGYTALQEEQWRARDTLDKIRAKYGVHVVLIGHAHVKTFNDPTGPAYDRYMLRMNEKVSSVWVAWADVVAFATMDVTVKGGKRGKEIEDPMGKGKATGGERTMFLSSAPAYEAKNRYSLPDEIPLSWSAFAKAIKWQSREDAVAPKQITAADVAASIMPRLATEACTEAEAETIAAKLITACGGDMRKSFNLAGTIATERLVKNLHDLRGGGAK
jgi:hypothetical protein